MLPRVLAAMLTLSNCGRCSWRSTRAEIAKRRSPDRRVVKPRESASFAWGDVSREGSAQLSLIKVYRDTAPPSRTGRSARKVSSSATIERATDTRPSGQRECRFPLPQVVGGAARGDPLGACPGGLAHRISGHRRGPVGPS